MKYLGGYNDVLSGFVVVKGKEFCEEIVYYYNVLGVVLSLFDLWLLICGMKMLVFCMR